MGRIIDVDALIEKCGEWYVEEGPEEGYIGTLKNLIGMQPTVGGWISVEDKLPRSMTNIVLVWLEHEELVGCIGFGHYEKYKGQEIWFNLENNEAFSVRGYKVTHWMPLPEPPKEDADDD